MRIAFMGTPDFAVPTLDRLVADGHKVAAVYTQPPRRAGRGKAVVATPVQRRAEALGLCVRSPVNFREPAEREAFAALDLDVAVVAAYGLILPPAILEAPRLGCLNVHASLLPRWRGAAPIQRAILAGDAETGITIMTMERGLDTGPMLLQKRTRAAGKTAGYLSDELSLLGAKLMSQVLDDPAVYPSVAQPEVGVTYAAKIEKHEARIDFTFPAEWIDRQIDAFNPSPGAFFEHGGERIRILQADWDKDSGPAGLVLNDQLRIACGEDAISPVRVQRAGRGEMRVDELLRGFPIPAGTHLT